MSQHVLLVGPAGHGGEGVYIDSLRQYPPSGVSYDISGDHHASAAGATCVLPMEVALNQIVHRLTIPDMGFRALKVRQRYDVVHVHAHPVLLQALGSIPLVMSAGSSSAVYLGDYLGWDRQHLGRRYARTRRLYKMLGISDHLLAMDRASKVYVFSHWARELNIAWGADGSKLEVIYPGFETPPPVRRDNRASFTFLFVGRDFERKGGYETIEAFARIADDLPSVHLIVAGSDLTSRNPDLDIHSWVAPARRARVSEQFRDLVARQRATHFPWVDRRRLLEEIYPAADVFVMPTHAEGFGFTNVEALSFGLPVITSTVGPAEEIIGRDRTGLLVSPGDVDGLANAMHQLAQAPETAREMGDHGRRDFLSRFTRERFLMKLGNLYDSVKADRP